MLDGYRYLRLGIDLHIWARITWTEPIMNKVNALLSDDRVRQMLSHPKSSFNLRDIMDTGKFLLIKLDKGKLRDTADLLGSLLMAKIKMAAFSRSDVPRSQRTRFYLYIDEFQNFASDSFAVVLSEARKYGLSFIMAHQTLAQVSGELRSITLGNTGIQVFFRVNRQDAQLLAKESFTYSGYQIKTAGMSGHKYWSYADEWEHNYEELQNLPSRVCYVKHKIKGGMISIKTVNIDNPWEVLGTSEEEYYSTLERLPFGGRYLLEREDIERDARDGVNRFKALPEAKASESEDTEAQLKSPAKDVKSDANESRVEAGIVGSDRVAARQVLQDIGDVPDQSSAHYFLESYLEGKSVAQIARELGVTRSWCSRSYRKDALQLAGTQFVKLISTENE